jgi:hypothetical protein
VRPSSLIHDDIRAGIAQRIRPPPCILKEKWLLCASEKVCARKRTRHNARRLVTAARRGTEDRTVDMWMPKPESQGYVCFFKLAFVLLLEKTSWWGITTRIWPMGRALRILGCILTFGGLAVSIWSRFSRDLAILAHLDILLEAP